MVRWKQHERRRLNWIGIIAMLKLIVNPFPGRLVDKGLRRFDDASTASFN